MARSFNGSSNLEINGTLSIVSGTPLTLACWGYLNSGNGYPFSVGNPVNGFDRYILEVVSGTFYAQRAYSNSFRSSSVAGHTTGVWNHLCGVFTSTTSRTAYLNGTAGTTNTASVVDIAPATMTIGVGVGTAVTPRDTFWNGQILWPSVWKAALDADEVASLAAGAHPTIIRPDSLVFFAPLGGFDGDYDKDTIGGLSLSTFASPTWSDDSPSGLVYPSMPIVGLGSASPPVSSIAPHVMHYKRMMTG